MPLFLSDEEFERCSNDGAAVAEKADAFIRELSNQLDTVRAQADAAAITAEQTCSLLEQKFVSLSSEFAKLESQNSALSASLEERSAELAQAQAEKHQINISLIAKDGDIERLSAEVSELHKSKRQLTDLLEQKDSNISEKNSLIKAYLDKILNLTDTVSVRESRLNEVEENLARSNASNSRLSQEKELVERHNVWLNDELTTKVNSLIELRKAYGELESEMSSKIADLERKLSESSSSLKWNKDNIVDLEKKLTAAQEELIACKDSAATNEERHCAELATVKKLVELYKESSQEWSKKAGELEGVIKALETHSSQIENDYKERLETEQTARKELEKEAAQLKEKLVKCESEIETSRRASERNLLPLSSSSTELWVDSIEEDDMDRVGQMVVRNVPSGVSGTALAASLLRDGWSLVKMYSKYQETVDALRHEQLARKQAQAILERVLFEIEEKAGVIMDERAEHERFVEAYSVVNQKLQCSLSEQNSLERTIQELKAELRRCERDNSIAHKESIDLQKQVTILLKECRDVQLRCGSGVDFVDDSCNSIVELIDEIGTEKVISERLLTFMDIHGLVEQNVQLRSLVRKLSDQIESSEMELKEKFELELHKHNNEAAAKVNAVLARAEEQGQMIESLHTTVAMYKRLYEEEHKHHSPDPRPVVVNQDAGRNNLMLLLEGSQEDTKKAQEVATERIRCLEDDVEKLRSEMILLRSERDKLALKAEFASDKLDRCTKDLEHQRDETNTIKCRNLEFSKLIIDHQRKLKDSSESLQAAEEHSRKLNMEVSALKRENEILSDAEKRASDEVRSLSERVFRLQASLDTIHSAAEAREEIIRVERRKQDEDMRKIQEEWAQAKKELDEKCEEVRLLTVDREEIRKSCFTQVEEMRKNGEGMRKELSKLTSAIAAAEARATAAEARYADMEKKIKTPGRQIATRDIDHEVSSVCTDEALTDLRIAREEIENLRDEVETNKAHMLQYKSIAQVNEDALKQMESAHENFKIEADKVRTSLEAELVSMKERFNELECEYSSKFKEAASSGVARETALNSALSEIDQLKQENSIKISQIDALEMRISSLEKDLDKAHKRWRDSQTNYERQIITQAETIQEMNKTTDALILLQEETSELRKSSDELRTENGQLKARWDCEKLMLEESKSVAEKKYDEINEQNKILHSRLEALYIKLAEGDRDSAGISSGSTDQTLPDAGLQNVVNYLRRSKEIAETEISLLKQEKLRMQSQLESAMKSAESAQASLRAVRENSRAMLFAEDEFKSLQLQVREVNLLRESNIQLREENKHNFEECQKLREAAQKARVETEELDSLLRRKQAEVEVFKKEVEELKSDKDLLEKKVAELVERCQNNVDVEDHHRMGDALKQMEVNLSIKEEQLEEVKKLLYEKEVMMSELEKDLSKSRSELSEKEHKFNEILQLEVSLKSEIERHKKLLAHYKRKLDMLTKEKEELRKQNDALVKQIDDYKQGRKELSDQEQVTKEKEKEKDTRIQMLEKIVERHREELKKEKDNHKMEKAKRLKTERAIMETITSVNQDKSKLVDGLEMHKQARERLADELEKLKHASNNLPQGTSVVQILSGTLLDDLSATYMTAVENFERVAYSVSSELGVPSALDNTPILDDASSLGQAVPLQAPSTLPGASITTSSSAAKPAEEREKKFTVPLASTEPRKTRRLVRGPKKPEGPQGDAEMSEVEKSQHDEKPVVSSHKFEVKETLAQLSHPFARKRGAPSITTEIQDESVGQPSSSDVEAPVLKKPKGSDSPKEITGVEIPENLDTEKESSDAITDELMDTEKDDAETVGEQNEDQNIDGTHQSELQNENIDVLEEGEPKENEQEGALDDGGKILAEQELHQSGLDSESEKEEGELFPDVGDAEEDVVEDQAEPVVPPVSSPLADEDSVYPIETSTPQGLNDEVDLTDAIEEPADNSINDNNQVEAEADQNTEAVLDASDGLKKEEIRNHEVVPDLGDKSSGGADVEVSGSKDESSSVAIETQEVRQQSPVGRTINLVERAKRNAELRRQQLSRPSPSPARGRGRVARGRGGRGQSSAGGRG